MSAFFGDHSEKIDAVWLDDIATIVRCPRCGNDAYARARSNSGDGHPLHRHVVVGCAQCGAWQVACLPEPIPQADVAAHA